MAVITVKALQSLTAADNGRRVSMGKSMYGTVRADLNGAVSVYVVWRYKMAGRTRQIPLGTWRGDAGTSLQALGVIRDDHAADLRKGHDPIELKAAEKLKKAADHIDAFQRDLDRVEQATEKQARLTVRSLFTHWQNLELKKRSDGGSEALRAFERDVFPLIGDLAVTDVKKVHIQRVVDTMMERDVVRMTKRVLSDLRQMFVFALERDYVEADPTALIKKAKIGPDGERDRVLSEAELIDFFKKLPLSGLSPTSRAALMIQLSTVARIGEILSARWEHVDFDRRLWVLPNTKNDKSHQIFLNDFALLQFEHLRDLTQSTPWVFPNAKLNGAVCSKTVTKQVADRQRDGDPMSNRTKHVDALRLLGGHWRPHDLRRTGASMMAELGALPVVIERCLNHTEENKMQRIYQRATYEGPMRDAWQLLGERLELLAAKPKNVRVFKRA